MATQLPTHDRLMNPLLRALRALGGSASVEEMYEKVIELEKFPEDVVAQVHDPESGMSEVGYRLAWARTYLKKYGLLENSERGVWSLTAKAKVRADAPKRPRRRPAASRLTVANAPPAEYTRRGAGRSSWLNMV
jgi:restriction endonuclease Mrr